MGETKRRAEKTKISRRKANSEAKPIIKGEIKHRDGTTKIPQGAQHRNGQMGESRAKSIIWVVGIYQRAANRDAQTHHHNQTTQQ